MSVRNQPKIYEANRRPKGRHPLFCFISFIGIYYPLTDSHFVHIVYINETNSETHPSAHTLNPPIHPFLKPTHPPIHPFLKPTHPPIRNQPSTLLSARVTYERQSVLN